MQNLYQRPAEGTATGRVWDIADDVTRETGRLAERAEVIRRFTAKGGNYNTASTQYHHWRNHREATAEVTSAVPPLYLSMQLKEAGRILLPAEVRSMLGVAEGDTLQAVLENGELRLMSRDTAIRRAQAMVRRHVPRGVSLVDELIADRRTENARETGQ